MTAALAIDKPKPSDTPQIERHAAAACYAIGGDARFISHHDELRMLVRALTRAGWPLAYSRGFNPKPRVVIPLPRSVGMASDCVWATVRLKTAPVEAELYDSLSATLPEGLRLRSVIRLDPGVKPHPLGIVYELQLAATDARKAKLGTPKLLEADSIEVRREYGPDRPARAVDIRPYIESVKLAGSELRIQLHCVGGATARPGEVLTALGLSADDYNHVVRRVGVTWDIELADPERREASDERKDIG